MLGSARHSRRSAASALKRAFRHSGLKALSRTYASCCGLLLLEQRAAHGTVFADVPAAEEHAVPGDRIQLPQRRALLPSGLQRMHAGVRPLSALRSEESDDDLCRNVTKHAWMASGSRLRGTDAICAERPSLAATAQEGLRLAHQLFRGRSAEARHLIGFLLHVVIEFTTRRCSRHTLVRPLHGIRAVGNAASMMVSVKWYLLADNPGDRPLIPGPCRGSALPDTEGRSQVRILYRPPWRIPLICSAFGCFCL